MATAASTSMLSVLVADPQLLFAQTLAIALGSYERLRTLDVHPTTGADTIAALDARRVDVALVNLWMTDLQAPAIIRAIHRRRQDVKVVVLADVYGAPHVQESVKAGAVGFLPKTLDLDRLADAVCRAGAGEAIVFAKELQATVERIEARAEHAREVADRLSELTPRELQVLRLINAGMPATDIATRLSITEATVRTHIAAVLDKLDARNQLEAAAVAFTHGLLG